MTYSSLSADLGTIMMDSVADLRSGSAEVRFINATPNSFVIKPRQIVAIAMQVDFVEMQPDIEPDDDKLISSAESIFTCVENPNDFMYPCIILDEAIDREE